MKTYFGCTVILLWLAGYALIPAAVLYVAWHFLHKYW